MAKPPSIRVSCQTMRSVSLLFFSCQQISIFDSSITNVKRPFGAILSNKTKKKNFHLLDNHRSRINISNLNSEGTFLETKYFVNLYRLISYHEVSFDAKFSSKIAESGRKLLSILGHSLSDSRYFKHRDT